MLARQFGIFNQPRLLMARLAETIEEHLRLIRLWNLEYNEKFILRHYCTKNVELERQDGGEITTITYVYKQKVLLKRNYQNGELMSENRPTGIL